MKGSKVAYLSGQKTMTGRILWNKTRSKGAIGRNTQNHSAVSTLEFGDVMLYGKMAIQPISLYTMESFLPQRR